MKFKVFQKKKVQYVSIGPSGKNRKLSKDREISRTKFGIQMIVDLFGDGYKSITIMGFMDNFC